MTAAADTRTKEQRAADDRDSVRSNLEQLGTLGAVQWAAKELPQVPPENFRKRRMLILTIQHGSRIADDEIRRARRLARCHAQGLKQRKQWR
jgi:hypothetical protein